MNEEKIISDLLSEGRRKVILDTDTFNEEDDQFALAYCVLSENIELKAVCAVPFDNEKSGDFARGMELSYDEIFHILGMMNVSDIPVFRGSTKRVERDRPAESEASEAIIRIARESDETVYVLAIGAATNIANALMLAPDIAHKITVIWLAGNPVGNESNWEFNLMQDITAGQILFESSVPLVVCPAWDVVSDVVAYDTDFARLRGKSELCEYLSSIVISRRGGASGWRKIIWDIAAPALIDRPRCARFKVLNAPALLDDGSYGEPVADRYIAFLEKIDRDTVIERTWELLLSME